MLGTGGLNSARGCVLLRRFRLEASQELRFAALFVRQAKVGYGERKIPTPGAGILFVRAGRVLLSLRQEPA